MGGNARMQLLLEKFYVEMGHNYVKKNLRITSPTGTGFPFNSEQLV